MKKRIGIPGWNVGDNTFGVGKDYLTFAARFGTPVILTPEMEMEELDLLILPGGADLNPARYAHQVPSYYTGVSNPMLEYFDAHRLPEYIQNETPIFGICRGAQSLWSTFGGVMVQDIRGHKQSDHNWDQCHPLHYTDDFKRYSKELSRVNSRHHQSMNGEYEIIPDELQVIAYAQEGNKYYTSIVELFQHRTLPIFGIQGHPENMSDDDLSQQIIESFLNR